MCAVYRVTSEADPTVERAVKVLLDDDPAMEARFIAEAELLASLDHPNLIDVFELHRADPDQDQPAWIVMELLGGRDLEELRDDAEALSPDQVARWFADVAQGLQRVHERGIVHRDIKPSNLMLGHDGSPRLIDFGIARQTSSAHQTRAGVVVGTASYLAPEMFLESTNSHLQDDPRSDVYGLGQTLCELLIRKPIHEPAEHRGPDRLIKIMRDKISRPHLDPRQWDPSVPKGLAQVVIDATRQEPSERITTAAGLEQRLRAYLAERAGAGVTAPVNRVNSASLPPPPTPGTTRRALAPSLPPQSAPTGGGFGRWIGVGVVGLVGLGLLTAVVLTAASLMLALVFAR